MIDFRKLTAVDIAFLGSRLILAEFSIGVFGSLALGFLTLLRSHSVGAIVLGSYLLFIGVGFPATTYYYRVESTEANGQSDGVKSTIQYFTTRG